MAIVAQSGTKEKLLDIVSALKKADYASALEQALSIEGIPLERTFFGGILPGYYPVSRLFDALALSGLGRYEEAKAVSEAEIQRFIGRFQPNAHFLLGYHLANYAYADAKLHGSAIVSVEPGTDAFKLQFGTALRATQNANPIVSGFVMVPHLISDKFIRNVNAGGFDSVTNSANLESLCYEPVSPAAYRVPGSVPKNPHPLDRIKTVFAHDQYVNF